MKASLGQLATFININDRLLGLIYRPTKESLRSQLEDILEHPEKLELLLTLTERLNRSLVLVKRSSVEFSVIDSREE